MTPKVIGQSEIRSILAFQIHGYNLKVYITQKMTNKSFYTMTEVFDITFPRSIQEVNSFTNRKNIESLISLYKVFWSNCCVAKQDKAEPEKLESSGFDISTIQTIKDGSMDCSRKCSLKY
ncbi:uncharacterized protein BX663DRAFT_269826 [Cokeromyces recurvatus]|uniref:uncharacterized protein n=1 Tax=Cokeromyces recurvatus TaxID=90255 RepID=UPI00221E4D47|nr:uncharacterized protein BX663DRAFT_269826 [Cokeromyces recurvatus]KAI7898191.1 hypothetical protein BX663DRAFT_269826 [Cokeromyces recurvatus]